VEATTTTRGSRHRRSLRTFHYGGLRRHSLCARCHDLDLGKGSGLLNGWRQIFLSSYCAGFFSFSGQIVVFPAQYKFGGQPSKITKLYVLLGDGFHLQARLDNSHGRSAKYTGDINEPGFRGRLLFSLGCYWSSGSSSRGRLWPAFFCRHLQLGSTRRLLCHLWHDLFYSGGWTEAPLIRSAHHVPVVFFPLIRGVGRWNFPRQLKIQLSTRNTSRQVLDYFTRGTHLLGSDLCHLQLLGDTLLRHIVRPSRWRRRLASKLVSGSSMRGIWRSPSRLNLDRS
jgi:hypothetical protein